MKTLIIGADSLGRPRRVENLTGRPFGRLIALHVVLRPGRSPRYAWECQCQCGNLTHALASNLLANEHRSCGCLRDETTKARATKHGLKHLPEYGVWSEMRHRCRNEKNKMYKYYGGRGIAVAPEWEDFLTFYREMGPRPGQEYSIERRKNNEGYTRDNCYWATHYQQMCNTRRNVFITFNNRTEILAEWARILNIDAERLRIRVKAGWSIERAFTEPVRPQRKLNCQRTETLLALDREITATVTAA